MEVIVKARMLLTSALLMFVQIPAPQAQVTVDVAKITCEQFSMEELPFCYQHDEMTVMDALKNMGLGK